MGLSNTQRDIIVGLILVSIVIVAAIIGLSSHKHENDSTLLEKLTESPNPCEEVYINHTYEVVHVYRVYTGNTVPYVVDYIENGEIKTLLAFTEDCCKTVVTVYPSSGESYLVYNERWFFYENGDKRVIDSKFNYELYLSSNTIPMGASTHYSRSRASDFESTIITIE